jgi:iron complex transport system substrate-binding protein
MRSTRPGRRRHSHPRVPARSLAVAGLALVLAAACGGDDDESGGAGNESDTREVDHAMGVVDVPVAPERVVVLDSSFLDAAVALGIEPVGATEATEGAGVPGYLADDAGDVAIVGLTDTPNLEAVAALRPDLILGAKVRHEEIYDELSGIAPTVFTESSGTNWKDGLAVTAEAMNMADDADSLMDDYEDRAAAIGEQAEAAASTATMVRFLPPDEIRLYGPETFSGTVLTDVGYELGDHPWDEYSMSVLSAEQIGRGDGDIVFATTYGTGEAGFPAAFASVEPLWDAIPAVAEGRQHWVVDDVWMLGIGPVGAGLVLDDIEEIVEGSAPAG